MPGTKGLVSHWSILSPVPAQSSTSTDAACCSRLNSIIILKGSMFSCFDESFFPFLLRNQ